MGLALLRNFSYIDVVVSGEGELAFRRARRSADSGRVVRWHAGTIARRIGRRSRCETATSHARSRWTTYRSPTSTTSSTVPVGSAVPARPHPISPLRIGPRMLVGGVRHCTFCGLNGEGMKFRSKSPERAVAELCELTARHPGLPVYAVDNIIDRDYFATFLPQLTDSSCEARIFYEVKGNLTKDQLRLLKDAGVRDIQPGLESLNDSILRIMRKGVTAITNVQLLKWCAELGLRPHWNLLWGFPGEPVAAFEEMAALIPKLAHLQPPAGRAPSASIGSAPTSTRPPSWASATCGPCPPTRRSTVLGRRPSLIWPTSLRSTMLRSAEPSHTSTSSNEPWPSGARCTRAVECGWSTTARRSWCGTCAWVLRRPTHTLQASSASCTWPAIAVAAPPSWQRRSVGLTPGPCPSRPWSRPSHRCSTQASS